MENLFLQCPSTTTLLGIVVILFTLYAFFSGFDGHRKEPPGPRPLPLLGNLLQLNFKSPHITLYELSKKHGPVFTFHFGPQKMVVLAGHKMIKQALVNHNAFSEKEVFAIINDLKLTHGIIFANGASWKEMRTFAQTYLKGTDKKDLEEIIKEECQHLIDVFKKKEGKAFTTAQPISYAISNIIWSIVFGSRFEYEDPVFISMVDRVRRNTLLLGSAPIQLHSLFPRLFNWIGTRKQMIESAFTNRRYMKEFIKDSEVTLNPHMCRGLVDSFLAHKKHLETSGKTNAHYHDDNLLVTINNLFSAGTDTTTSTLTYGLLVMAKYPKIQERVQEELSRVVGCHQVQMQDKKKLPYTDAVIHEIQRMADIVPTVRHCTSRDVSFQGYIIKKGTPVLVLLSSALHDDDEWEKPHTFNADHFLDDDGNFRKREAFLPFSAGPRVCAGESLARMELFFFFTSLLQRFRFTPPPGVTEDELDLTMVGAFTQSPLLNQLCAISRD